MRSKTGTQPLFTLFGLFLSSLLWPQAAEAIGRHKGAAWAVLGLPFQSSN
jgi:hypothetical protein